MKKNTKKQTSPRSNGVNTALVVLCICMFVLAGIYIARYYALMHETKRDNQALADLYKNALVATEAEPEPVSPPEAVTPAPSTAGEADPIIITYPRAPEAIAAVFEEARAINPDVIGYLHIPQKTVEDIDLFVVQRDNEYYLNHDFYGNEKKSGTLFLDQSNQIWPQDQHLIVYGHNMKNGTMFARLPRYKAQEYAYNNPFVYFDTLYEKGEYVVVAAMYLPASEMLTTEFNLRTFTFGETSMKSFMYKVSKRALYTTGVGVDENDQLLSLVTCAYNEDDERFILITRRIRENETKEELRKLIK